MKNNKFISLLAIGLICFSLTGCGETTNTKKEDDVITLNVYNCADYIAETERNEDGEMELGVVDLFEQYCKDELGLDVVVMILFNCHIMLYLLFVWISWCTVILTASKQTYKIAYSILS